MDAARKIFRYLANLEWTEKIQKNCILCDRQNFQNIVYEVLKKPHLPLPTIEMESDD